MSAEIDYYEVLGIAPNADLDQIKRAYRDQMRRYHPDAFLGQMAKARESGDLREIRTLERKIEESKRKTQEINVAYGVLSDPTRRQTYDMRRAGVPEQRGAAYAPDDDPYRAGPYAARDYHNPTRSAARPTPRPRPINDSFPLALFVVLGAGLFFIMGTMIFIGTMPPPNDDLPAAGDGRLSARQLQATESAKQATRIAWTQVAMQPTFTPSPPEEEVRRGDALRLEQSYALAVELYTRAINQNYTGEEVHFKRGLAYLGMGDPESLQRALADFDRALMIDPSNAAAYQERAITRAGLWTLTRDAALIDLIRADAAQFEALGGVPDERLRAVLATLPQS
jgi:curved DNA-binding protein CbpA